jgi:hypothetical protein
MGLRPTQGNEKRLGPASALYATVNLSLSSRPKRSGGTCGSADPSWRCFSTERSGEICGSTLGLLRPLLFPAYG